MERRKNEEGRQGRRNIKEKSKRKKNGYMWQTPKKSRLRIPRNAGKLDDWRDWKLWKCGRLEKIIIRDVKFETLLEPLRIREVAKFGRLGDPGHTRDSGVLRDSRDLGNREIGGNRYMLQKCETLAGRTHGEPTKWEIGSFGDAED